MNGQTNTTAIDHDVDRLDRQLCRLACDVATTVDHLAEHHLSDGRAALLAVPIRHLEISLERIGQLVHEAENLDDVSRRRLGAL